jgi:hypothetical protein
VTDHSQVVRSDVELVALERAATAVAKSDVPLSNAYECARDVWGLWWARYRELSPGRYQL